MSTRVHDNATTTPRIRRYIQESDAPSWSARDKFAAVVETAPMNEHERLPVAGVCDLKMPGLPGP